MIVEGDLVLLGKLFRLGADLFVILVTAVEEGGGKGIGPDFLGLLNGLAQAHIITKPAAATLVEYDLAQVVPQSVFPVVFHGKVFPGGELLHGHKAFFEFPVWVDIGVIKKAAHPDPLSLQEIKGIGGTGPTADVE